MELKLSESAHLHHGNAVQLPAGQRQQNSADTSSGVRHEGADTETPNWPKIIGPWVDENARQSVNRSPVSRGIAGRPAETPDAQNSLASPGFSPSRLNLAGHVVRGRWRSTV